MPRSNDMDIFCADIGSVKRDNFGWYAVHGNGTTAEGTTMKALGTAIADSINLKRQVALGFEAPMFVPLRDAPEELTMKRQGETNPNWIGGPGAAVLATALAQVPWILRDVKTKLTITADATLDWDKFKSKKFNLFLWEAFVSGNSKGNSHVDDARIAIEAFKGSLPDPKAHNAIAEPVVLSLLGAALIRTGWSSDIQLLSESCVVIKA
jgi:hypothetical protein